MANIERDCLVYLEHSDQNKMDSILNSIGLSPETINYVWQKKDLLCVSEGCSKSFARKLFEIINEKCNQIEKPVKRKPKFEDLEEEDLKHGNKMNKCDDG